MDIQPDHLIILHIKVAICTGKSYTIYESDGTKDFLVLTHDKIGSPNSETWEKKVHYPSTNDFWRLNTIIRKTDSIRSETSKGSVKKTMRF